MAVSGGPDSLALAAMCKAVESNYKKEILLYTHKSWNKEKFIFRTNQVKKILKKQGILLKVLINKKRLIIIFNIMQEK